MHVSTAVVQPLYENGASTTHGCGMSGVEGPAITIFGWPGIRPLRPKCTQFRRPCSSRAGHLQWPLGRCILRPLARQPAHPPPSATLCGAGAAAPSSAPPAASAWHVDRSAQDAPTSETSGFVMVCAGGLRPRSGRSVDQLGNRSAFQPGAGTKPCWSKVFRPPARKPTAVHRRVGGRAYTRAP